LAKQLLHVTIQEGEHSSVSAPLSVNQQWKSELLERLNAILVKLATSPTLFPSPSAKTKKSNVTLRATRVQRQISYSGGIAVGGGEIKKYLLGVES